MLIDSLSRFGARNRHDERQTSIGLTSVVGEDSLYYLGKEWFLRSSHLARKGTRQNF